MAGTEAHQQRGWTVAFWPNQVLIKRTSHQFRLDIGLWSALKLFSIEKSGAKNVSSEQEDQRERNLLLRQWSGDKTITVLTSENFKLTFSIISPSFRLFIARLSLSQEAGSSWAHSQSCQFHWIALPALQHVPLKCLLTKDVSYFPRINSTPNIWQRVKDMKNLFTYAHDIIL